VSACVIHVHPLRLNGGGDVTFSERRLDMETRVAVLAIIVREGSSVETLNDLLHQYGKYIIGRMGVPYHQRGVNVISVAMDAPADVISALSGKIGRLQGITAKTVYAPETAVNQE
jgi:putative iron-only hydrogenase system regulator